MPSIDGPSALPYAPVAGALMIVLIVCGMAFFFKAMFCQAGERKGGRILTFTLPRPKLKLARMSRSSYVAVQKNAGSGQNKNSATRESLTSVAVDSVLGGDHVGGAASRATTSREDEDEIEINIGSPPPGDLTAKPSTPTSTGRFAGAANKAIKALRMWTKVPSWGDFDTSDGDDSSRPASAFAVTATAKAEKPLKKSTIELRNEARKHLSDEEHASLIIATDMVVQEAHQRALAKEKLEQKSKLKKRLQKKKATLERKGKQVRQTQAQNEDEDARSGDADAKAVPVPKAGKKKTKQMEEEPQVPAWKTKQLPPKKRSTIVARAQERAHLTDEQHAALLLSEDAAAMSARKKALAKQQKAEEAKLAGRLAKKRQKRTRSKEKKKQEEEEEEAKKAQERGNLAALTKGRKMHAVSQDSPPAAARSTSTTSGSADQAKATRATEPPQEQEEQQQRSRSRSAAPSRASLPTEHLEDEFNKLLSLQPVAGEESEEDDDIGLREETGGSGGGQNRAEEEEEEEGKDGKKAAAAGKGGVKLTHQWKYAAAQWHAVNAMTRKATRTVDWGDFEETSDGDADAASA